MRIALRPMGLACCLLAAWPFSAAVASHSTARHASAPVESAWDHAARLRVQLEASQPEQRTREKYEAVLDAFRLIYHQKPDAAKAPAAVAAVADLLAEKGRVLSNKGALLAAIGQYEFLREQYPESPQVDNALLLEAEICRQDLKDTECAKDKLRQVVEEQPDTSFAEQASLELKSLEPASFAERRAEASLRRTPREAALAARRCSRSRFPCLRLRWKRRSLATRQKRAHRRKTRRPMRRRSRMSSRLCLPLPTRRLGAW